MKIEQSHNVSRVHEIAVFLGLFALAFAFLLNKSGDVSLSWWLPNIYHGRDLNRAFDLYHNFQLIWHGPELTGGGQLPGPFYYFVLGFPLWLFGTYTAVIYFQLTLAALTAALIWKFVARYSAVGAILMYFYFIGSPYMQLFFSVSWNPSFLPLFSILTIILLSRLQSNRSLFWGGVVAGLALQIHFLQFIFVLGAVIAILFEKNRREKLFWVLSGVILPLIPHLIYRVLSANLHETDSNIGIGVSSFFARLIGDEASPSWLARIFIFHGNDILSVPIVLLCLYGLRNAFLSHRFLVTTLAISFFPAVLVSQQNYLARYVFPLVLVAGLIAAVTTSQVLSRFKWRFYAFLAASVALCFAIRFYYDPHLSIRLSFAGVQKYWLFLAIGLVITIWLLKNRAQKVFFAVLLLCVFANRSYLDERAAQTTYEQRHLASDLKLNEGEDLLREIIQSTGWSYQQFRERTFMQGGGRSEDYSFIWASLQKGISASSEKYDGVIIKSLLQTKTQLPARLSEVSCSKETTIGNLSLCYYSFSDPTLKVRLNNIGFGYDYFQPELFEVTKPSGTHQFDPRNAAFYFNFCERYLKSCSVYFNMHLTGDLLRIEVLGDPVGARLPSVNPSYATNLRKPSIAILCSGQTARFEIAASLGMQTDNSTFLAPYDAVFKLPCSVPEKITLHLDDYRTIVGDLVFGKGVPLELSWIPPRD